jgi:hypothetical protein
MKNKLIVEVFDIIQLELEFIEIIHGFVYDVMNI